MQYTCHALSLALQTFYYIQDGESLTETSLLPSQGFPNRVFPGYSSTQIEPFSSLEYFPSLGMKVSQENSWQQVHPVLGKLLENLGKRVLPLSEVIHSLY